MKQPRRIAMLIYVKKYMLILAHAVQEKLYMKCENIFQIYNSRVEEA